MGDILLFQFNFSKFVFHISILLPVGGMNSFFMKIVFAEIFDFKCSCIKNPYVPCGLKHW